MKHRRRIVLAEGIESSVTSEKIEKNAMSDVMPADMVWIFRAVCVGGGAEPTKDCRFDSTPTTQKALKWRSRRNSSPVRAHIISRPHRILSNCLFLLAHIRDFRCQVCIYSCYIISWQFTLQITETKKPFHRCSFLHHTQHSYFHDFTAWTVYGFSPFLLLFWGFPAFYDFFFLPSRTHPHNPSSSYFWLSFFPLILFCSRCALPFLLRLWTHRRL